MFGLSIGTVLLFSAAVGLQIVFIRMLPLSGGYTNVIPTVIALVAINSAMWILARLIAVGAQVSILIPASATLTPLAAVAVGVMLDGESASPYKIAALVGGCLLVGVASKIS